MSSVLSTLNMEAAMHMALGETSDALAKFRHVLAQRRRKLIPDHPLVIASTHNLGACLYHAGPRHWEEAAKLIRRVLNQRTTLLGPMHPDTLSSVVLVVHALCDMGLYREAAEIAVPRFQPIFKAAVSLYQTGECGAAALANYALLMCYEQLSNGSPTHTNQIFNFASCLVALDQFELAEPLLRRVLADTERTKGADCEETVVVMMNTAQCIMSNKQLPEAEVMLKRVLEISRRLYGSSDTKTLIAMDALGGNLIQQEKFAQGISLFTTVLRLRENLHGTREHPDVLTSMSNVAMGMSKMGNPEDGVDMLTEAVEISSRVLPKGRPERIVHEDNLAQCQRQLREKQAKAAKPRR